MRDVVPHGSGAIWEQRQAPIHSQAVRHSQESAATSRRTTIGSFKARVPTNLINGLVSVRLNFKLGLTGGARTNLRCRPLISEAPHLEGSVRKFPFGGEEW